MAGKKSEVQRTEAIATVHCTFCPLIHSNLQTFRRDAAFAIQNARYFIIPLGVLNPVKVFDIERFLFSIFAITN